MAQNNDDSDLVFYPAFCFKASPTHFSWVKMAAVDVHRLVKVKGFEAQNIFFYKNHPIRFVTLVGLIIARTEAYRRTILTLDDSSGATIEIVVLKSENPVPGPDYSTRRTTSATTTTTTQTLAPEQTPTHLSTTTKTPLDITHLVPGTLIKVKGTLSTFRSVMQVQLERFFPVPDTSTEMQFLDDRVRYLVDVLSVPWVLTEEEVEELRVEADEEGRKVEEEKRRGERKVRRRLEREERDQRRILRMYEFEERVREKEAKYCREAGRRVMSDIERRKKRDGHG